MLMQEKDIRNILVSYITAEHREVRIYQEKSIGSSVCDVMAVTDQLTGYEIKSDFDNYSRLHRQVAEYSAFFDENYVVVSRKHIGSVAEKIPFDWGIICILDDAVSVERKAQKNKNVRRRKQLSILWKLEMKNLLVKNDLPLFAQKDKGYIANRLAASVPEDILGKQIAAELMGRDYSIYNAEDYTIHSVQESATNLPELDIVDILSEENLESYTLDKWIDLYKQAKDIRQKKDIIYKSKPVTRMPHEIPYTDIEVYPGAPWISPDIINEFVHEVILELSCPYNRNHSGTSNAHVVYESVTGSWHVNNKNDYRNDSPVTIKYGIKRYNGLYIFEAILNSREIKLYDSDMTYNEYDTVAALEKKQIILDAFKSWVWKSEDRRWEIEDAYNKMFAEYKPCKYDGAS